MICWTCCQIEESLMDRKWEIHLWPKPTECWMPLIPIEVNNLTNDKNLIHSFFITSYLVPIHFEVKRYAQKSNFRVILGMLKNPRRSRSIFLSLPLLRCCGLYGGLDYSRGGLSFSPRPRQMFGFSAIIVEAPSKISQVANEKKSSKIDPV